MDDIKQAAAIAAVMAYIREEEEIACAMAMQAQPSPAPPAHPPQKPWGLNGRQAQMQLRSLMQLKAFHSAKF